MLVNDIKHAEKLGAQAPVPSLEQRIIASILNKIRQARRAPAPTNISRTFQATENLLPARIREVKLDDCSAVMELKRRWGLGPDTSANWDKLWVRNPALRDADPGRPMGWALEAGGAIVGYIGNISSTYFYGDQLIRAVTAHGLVVEPMFRAMGVSLNASFFRQKFTDLYLGTTAIESVDRISRVFKCSQLPQPDYDTVLFWVLRPFRFAEAVAKKLNLGPYTSYCGGAFGSVAFATDKLVGRRWPRAAKSKLTVKKIQVREIGDDFDGLWNAKQKEALRLLADRRAATLRWHFDIPGDQAETAVLCCYGNRELLGYLVIRHEQGHREGPRRSIVCDLLIKQDRREVLEELFVVAYDEAKRAGSHVCEVMGFPANVREVFQQWNPYQRQFPSCPFHFKAANPEFHSTLLNEAIWYASPYDGDTTLMP
ncbi:MAG: hypothetical protein ABSC15_14670 [Terriglobales bacterium]|jgi:hypothetical protein